MSCFKYSFFTRAKTLLLEVLICPREIAPRESRQIQPGDRTHWFSNLVDELLINKPTGRVVPNSSETCMSQLNYESHSHNVLNVLFYNSTTISPCCVEYQTRSVLICSVHPGWLRFGPPHGYTPVWLETRRFAGCQLLLSFLGGDECRIYNQH